MPANLDSGASSVKRPLLLVSSQILEKQAEEIYRHAEGDPFYRLNYVFSPVQVCLPFRGEFRSVPRGHNEFRKQ
jgi:hypothetical protein